MAYKTFSSLALLFISSILLATAWQAAARNNIPKNTETQDKKEPEWFSHSHGGVYIPGIGRVGLPPTFGIKPTPQTPYIGGTGALGSGPGSGRSYVPGADDTIVPNPGFVVPNPGSGSGVAPTPVLP